MVPKALLRGVSSMEEVEGRFAERALPVHGPADVKAEARRLLETFAYVATEEEARPYAEAIGKLMSRDDESYYHAASDAARASGLEFVRRHQGTCKATLEELCEAPHAGEQVGVW